jgi:hypothetical protein
MVGARSPLGADSGPGERLAGTASPTERTLCIWIFPEIPLTRDCGLPEASCRLPAEY